MRVLRWAPLDRARAKLNLWGSKDPFLGIPSVIEAPAFDRPPARIFRIVESPRYIAADAELAKHLSKVTKKAIGPIEDVTDASVFNEGYAKQKPFVVKDPRAAADAYGRLSRGEQGSRKAVLQHPLYALALALDVDRDPATIRAPPRAVTPRPRCSTPSWSIVVRTKAPARQPTARSRACIATRQASIA